MASSLPDALCKEIETFRIDKETPTTTDGEHGDKTKRRRSTWHSRRRRANTFAPSTSIDVPTDRPENPTLLVSRYTPTWKLMRRVVKQKSSSLYIPRGTDCNDSGTVKPEDKTTVKIGWLYKTSRPITSKGKAGSTRGHRQHRKFKLTTHSLEYSHFLQKVCQL